MYRSLLFALLCACGITLSCSPLTQAQDDPKTIAQHNPIKSITPGYDWQVLMRSGQTMHDGNLYAPDNDRVSYFEIRPGYGYLLVGHELHYQDENNNGQYSRLTYDHGKIIASERWFKGMHNFCAGGKTPWGTLLSGEEYPMNAFPGTYAERDKRYETEHVNPQDPAARFGWVYEINPWTNDVTKRATRRTALGRFSHEGIVTYDEKTVYLTEDWQPGYFFKFTADHPHDLSSGTLFVFSREQGWLKIEDLYNVHSEAKRLNASQFNKLEDLVIGIDGNLYISESGDPKRNDPYGRVLKFNPKTLDMSTFVAGNGTQLANPDNLAVHPISGKLLICEDQTRDNNKAFGDNEVWWADPEGKLQSALTLADGGEPSGPSFSPDGKTLFLSVIDGPKSNLLEITL